MNRRKMMLLQLLVPMLMVFVTSSSNGAVPPSGVAVPPIQERPLVPGRLIVSLTPGSNASDVAMDHGLSITGEIADGRFVILGASHGQERQTAGLLNADARVEFAEPDWLRRLHEVPDDNDYFLKWGLDNDGTLCDGSDCATVGADMDWQQAYTLLGSGFAGSAVVAVIDTGIDSNHPDLNDKIIAGYDFYNGDTDPTDTYGHGTHVAGIALAETNNGIGTAGVGYSSNISVMPLRVGAENGLPTSAIVSAIYHAANNGANVINMSLGGRFGSSSEQKAINDAWNKGLIVVASSGNDASGKVSYPAAFTNCIAVGSTNWHDRLAPYSNKGGDLDVVAPGGDMVYYGDPGGIYSTMPTYDVYLTTSYSYLKNYDQLQGTSMSAPQVSGLAALLFAIGVTDENGNGRTNDEIRDIIETTADDLGKSGWDREYGWGRINVYNAVLAAIASGGGTSDDPPIVSITNPANNNIISGSITITADAADDNDVTQVEFFVDGNSIGTDTDGLDGWSAPLWGTTDYAEGPASITATATDTAGQTASDSISVTVDNIPSAGIDVTSISPNTMLAGSTLTNVTITGSGFLAGAAVTLENGAGSTPATSNIVVGDENTITLTIKAKNGGPRRNRVWDVRVTNPDSSTGILSDGFTVKP